MHIPLFKTVVSEEAIEAMNEVLRSGWLGAGPRVSLFEKKFAAYTNNRFCVCLNSCTAALHLGLKVLDLAPGTEVISTPITFVSTNHAILYNSCKVVFADIESETGNLDVKSVEKKISPSTGAIIIMHYGGYPCDIDAFYALSAKTGIPVIEDCAHACGAAYKGQPIGSHGNIHAFSFHAVKNLPIGDGGALILKSHEHYKRIKRLKWLGIDRDTFERTNKQAYQWEYNVNEIGFKYQMNDIHAALALAQLKCLDKNNDKRRQIAERYRQNLKNVTGVKLLDYSPDRQSSYHLFCIKVEERDNLVTKLKTEGVDAGVHYKRNDLYPMYEKQNLPNAEKFWRSVISLPMHIELTDEQIDYITDVIRKGW
jgi:perosamine synthetase